MKFGYALVAAITALSNPLVVNAAVDPEVHKLCVEAKDYKGCVEASSESTSESTSESDEVEVAVPTPAPYNYEKDSVRKLKIRGKYGRYLTFIGRTANTYRGTSGSFSPGTSGTLNCSSYGSTTSCYRSGAIAPSYTPSKPGGTQRRRFRYELDCQDQTYNIKGDLNTAGGFKKGWMHVSNDPVANAVAKKYCPIIDTLAVDQHKQSNVRVGKKGGMKWKDRWGEEPQPAPGEDQMALMGNYFKSKQYKKALKLSKQLVVEFPDHPRVWNALGISNHMLMNYSAAKDNYTQAIYINPMFDSAYYNRGLNYQALGSYDYAIADYSKAISLYSKEKSYWTNRSSAYWAKGDKKKACSDARKAIELGYKDVRFLKFVKKNCKKYK